jgi:hypothetical protein
MEEGNSPVWTFIDSKKSPVLSKKKSNEANKAKAEIFSIGEDETYDSQEDFIENIKKTTKRKNKPLKPKLPKKVKTIYSWENLEFIENKNEEKYFRCYDYTIYSTNLIPTRIGIDIGTKFCAIVGITKDDNNQRIITHAVSLHPGYSDDKKKASGDKDQKGPEYWRNVEKIIYHDENFKWFFQSKSYRIEQQKDKNLSNAYGFLSMCAGICFHRKVIRDVKFTNASIKYNVPKKDCDHCEKINKESNDKKKTIVLNFKCYLEKTKQENLLGLINVMSSFCKKPDDIPDAFYIASCDF